MKMQSTEHWEDLERGSRAIPIPRGIRTIGYTVTALAAAMLMNGGLRKFEDLSQGVLATRQSDGGVSRAPDVEPKLEQAENQLRLLLGKSEVPSDVEVLLACQNLSTAASRYVTFSSIDGVTHRPTEDRLHSVAALFLSVYKATKIERVKEYALSMEHLAHLLHAAGSHGIIRGLVTPSYTKDGMGIATLRMEHDSGQEYEVTAPFEQAEEEIAKQLGEVNPTVSESGLKNIEK